MRTLLVWIVSILMTGIIISPFFWFGFLKNIKKLPYIAYSSILSLTIFVVFFFWGDDYIDKILRKYNTKVLYIYNNADVYAVVLYAILMLISPFIFTKILYGKITVKSFFVSLLLSVIIFVVLFLIFAYYIFPKAAEGFLINI